MRKKNKNKDIKIGRPTQKLGVIEKISKLIQRYGIGNVIMSTTIFIIMTIVVILAFNQRPIIESILKEREKSARIEEYNMINLRLTEINPRIENILYKLLIRNGVDRAFIFEMHNGIENIGGLPFVFFDMTYEGVKDDSIYHISKNYLNINVSRYTISTYLARNNHFVGTIEELRCIDPVFAFKLKEDDISFIAIYPIRTSKMIVGWVCLANQDNSVIEDVTYLEGSMLDASIELSNLFDITQVQETSKRW